MFLHRVARTKGTFSVLNILEAVETFSPYTVSSVITIIINDN